jgi:hypothetical protein
MSLTDSARDATVRCMLRIACASFLLGCLLSGCSYPAVYALRPGTVTPVTANVTPDQRAALWQRAIGVLLDEGYVPQVLNEAACFVSAKQRDDLVMPTGTVGATVVVTISPDGVVRVQVSGTGVYNSVDDLAADINQRQQALLSKIVSGAATAAAKPSS